MKYDMYHVKRPFGIANGINAYHGRQYQQRYVQQYLNRQDHAVKTVCTGCGRTLGKFDLLRHTGLCSRCRRFLSQETAFKGNICLDSRINQIDSFMSGRSSNQYGFDRKDW